MNNPVKKKLCWNCEGGVAANAENCPYCGVTVVPATLDNVSTSFTPSYRAGSTQEDSFIPRSPYAEKQENEPLEQNRGEAELALESDEPAYDEFQRALLATILLLTGSVFFLFGLVLMLFSRNGVFTLQWDGSIWFIYLAFAIPLLFFGWRYLTKLE